MLFLCQYLSQGVIPPVSIRGQLLSSAWTALLRKKPTLGRTRHGFVNVGFFQMWAVDLCNFKSCLLDTHRNPMWWLISKQYLRLLTVFWFIKGTTPKIDLPILVCGQQDYCWLSSSEVILPLWVTASSTVFPSEFSHAWGITPYFSVFLATSKSWNSASTTLNPLWSITNQRQVIRINVLNYNWGDAILSAYYVTTYSTEKLLYGKTRDAVLWLVASAMSKLDFSHLTSWGELEQSLFLEVGVVCHLNKRGELWIY